MGKLACRQEGLAVLLVTDSHERVIAPGVHVLPWGMRMGPDEEFPPTDRLRQLLVEARDLVDIVVIDGPPALGNADASRLASVVDRAILVAVNGRTSATDVATAKQQMESRGTKVLGLVTTARPSWLVRSVSDRSVAKR